MNYEILSDEQIAWQAQRVATAFGVRKFTCKSSNDSVFFCQGRVGRSTVRWTLSRAYGPVSGLYVGKGRTQCKAFRTIGGNWQFSRHSDFNEQMARGCYCLGIEEKVILDGLECSFSVLEKVELRLSLAYEFWPQTWLDEK